MVFICQIHIFKVFGEYELNFNLKEEGIELSIKGKGKRKRYYRNLDGDEIEKFIYAESGKLVVCPVEPVNLPKIGVAEHLMIEFDKPLIIEPGVKDSFFVKFPVEIGIFLVDKKDIERIDIFTKTRAKYILYGPPENGIICRWWKSKSYNDMPEVNKLQEGIMKVEVENNYHEWLEMKRIVFRAFDMKLFYNEYAYMHSYLNILKKTMGETAFNKRKPKNMKESIDIYLAKGIKRIEKKFIMEWGFK